MGLNETYRLNAATLSIYSHDGHRTPVMIPQGAKVTTTEGPLNGFRMVFVKWETKTVMMFTSDLQERGEIVPLKTRRSA